MSPMEARPRRVSVCAHNVAEAMRLVEQRQGMRLAADGAGEPSIELVGPVQGAPDLYEYVVAVLVSSAQLVGA